MKLELKSKHNNITLSLDCVKIIYILPLVTNYGIHVCC